MRRHSTRSTRGITLSSPRQKVTVAVAAAVAVSVLGVAALRDVPADSSTPDALVGTVTAEPGQPVDVVDLTTPEQAAIGVSSRLFATADIAVLTDSTKASTTAAIATATRLKVPILLDDPASPAELTRLRAARVLTFGIVANVVGATPAETDPEALDAQVAALEAAQTTPSDPGTNRTVDAIVLMKSAKTFAVAAASTKIAGATVLESAEGDLRKDAKTAAALAKRPDAAVITLGDPFAEKFAYSLAAVQNDATQIGGGYFALPDRRFVGLHGKIGDPASGMLGQQNTQASIKIIKQASSKFDTNDSRPIVPMFQIVADEAAAADLEPVVDAAEKAGLYVLLDLRPGSSTFLAQAKSFEDLLKRKNVGLTLEPAFGTGTTTAEEINQVSTWLADLTAADALPQKLLVVREKNTSAVADRKNIDTSYPELSLVLDVDVVGDPSTKLAAWRAARSGAPKGVSFGWMQYKVKDQPLFTVNQTYKLIAPYPSVVTYQ